METRTAKRKRWSPSISYRYFVRGETGLSLYVYRVITNDLRFFMQSDGRQKFIDLHGRFRLSWISRWIVHRYFMNVRTVRCTLEFWLKEKTGIDVRLGILVQITNVKNVIRSVCSKRISFPWGVFIRAQWVTFLYSNRRLNLRADKKKIRRRCSIKTSSGRIFSLSVNAIRLKTCTETIKLNDKRNIELTTPHWDCASFHLRWFLDTQLE